MTDEDQCIRELEDRVKELESQLASFEHYIRRLMTDNIVMLELIAFLFTKENRDRKSFIIDQIYETFYLLHPEIEAEHKVRMKAELEAHDITAESEDSNGG